MLHLYRFVPFLVLALATGCGESDAARVAREQVDKINRENEERSKLETAGTLSLYMVMQPIQAVKDAEDPENDPTVRTAVAELNQVGAPIVTALQTRAAEGEKADRIAAIFLLGQLGAVAHRSEQQLEGLAQTDAEIQSAAAAAVAKIRAATP